jgi:sugar (pentulose or hexulose) kinase
VATASAPTPWRRVPTGAELDADELLRAAVSAAAGALEAAPEGPVAGVGVAGMAETGVLADARGRPVVPCVAWHDSRGEAEVERIAAELGAEEFAERTGLPLTPLPTLPKYAWMRAHWPESQRGVRWLNVAEWVVRGLGGDEIAEASLASRTGFYDLHTGAPWEAALVWAGAPAGLAPPHTPAGTPAGHAGDGAPPRARGAALTVGGHDHLAAAVGAGAAGTDDVLDSCGTAEAWVRASAPLAPERVREATAGGITVGWHAVAGRHALLGSVRSGAVLQAVLDLLGVPAGARDELEHAALQADAGELRLAGFKGEGLTISGVAAGASPAALYRAALESLGAAGAEILATMDAVAGPHGRLVVTGGWAAGEAARAVKARHLGPFEHLPEVSTGARGAALAAGRAAAVLEVA